MFLDKPVIILGVFLMLVSLVGLIGACCRVSRLLWVYLLVMFLLIVVLFGITIFAFAVTNKDAEKVLSNRGYNKYKLGDYSQWLQKRVNNTKNWNKIKNYLIDSKVCSNFRDKYANDTIQTFYYENLLALQNIVERKDRGRSFIQDQQEIPFHLRRTFRWKERMKNLMASFEAVAGNEPGNISSREEPVQSSDAMRKPRILLAATGSVAS